MKKFQNSLLVAVVVCVLPVIAKGQTNTMEKNSSDSVEETRMNPLLAGWTGPYEGVPPFDKVMVGHFQPAFETAISEKLMEIDRIAADPAPATFANTIGAMERSGALLDRVSPVYGVWSSGLSTPEFREVQRVIEPKLAAARDRIVQNEKLFRRIEALYKSAPKGLSPEEQRLLWLTYTNFVRAGARLNASQKERLSAINQRLASLFTTFSQNVLADETNYFVVIEGESDLAGLPEFVVKAARREAIERKLDGKWVISNTRSAVDPFLTYAENRGLREKVWKMFVGRGDNANENNNNALITEILQLRLERARLLGYRTHAHWTLENTMAKTPEAAMDLMMTVWKPAVARVREEVAEMTRVAGPLDGGIQPWDYRFYMEKVRKAKYDLDLNEVKPYLQLDKLREGMFFVAEELFGMQFLPAQDVAVFHPDVSVWEVRKKDSGEIRGLFYFDPFSRQGKRSGAWMTSYRSQHKMEGRSLPIVSNNSNFVKGDTDRKVLISWDDATTLFHEFGHALHGLSSDVTYKSVSGTSVFRDYVELPSQLLEHWLSVPDVLNRFAVHYQTGEPMPPALVEKIRRASTFNQGFATVEYLASGLVDMKLHLNESASIDPAAFEKETLAALGMPEQIVMRHRTPQFLHAFSGDGYAAGYYSYLWADVLTADAFNAFMEASGPFDKVVAKKLFDNILSAGNTVDPAAAYQNFRGRAPLPSALLRKRGFPSPKKIKPISH